MEEKKCLQRFPHWPVDTSSRTKRLKLFR